MHKQLGGLLVGLLMASTVFAADWAQFCGPQRNNISSETGLARSWPAEGPKALWSVEVTEGYSGAAIKDGKVYFLEHADAVSSLRCLDLKSGKDLWSVLVDDPGEFKGKKYPGTRGTPTVTDDAVYAVTLHGNVFAVDLKTKTVKWELDFLEHGRSMHRFGFAQSPVVEGDLVLLAPLSEEHSVMAVHKETGKVVWNLAGYPGNGFVSPVLWTLGGEQQLIVVAGGEEPKRKRRRQKEAEAEEIPSEPLRPTRVFALSPQTGKLLWNYEGWFCKNPIPHPLLVARDTLFLTSGYKSVSQLVKVRKGVAGYTVEKLMETEEAASWIEQPILVDDHLYVGGNTKKPKAGLVCIDLAGKVKWDSNTMDSAPAYEHLNMISADGLLIGLDGKSGMLHLIEASAKAFKELASAQVLSAEDAQNWGPIALSDGKLIVRDHHTMKCLDLR